jgi:hypothetical protein
MGMNYPVFILPQTAQICNACDQKCNFFAIEAENAPWSALNVAVLLRFVL